MVEDLLPERIGDLVVGAPAPVAGNQSSRSLGPVSDHQALDLPHAQVQLPCRLFLPQLPVDNLLNHPQPVHRLLCHRNGLLCHHPSRNQKGTLLLWTNIEIATLDVDLEVIEDLDFYEWLSEQDIDELAQDGSA